MVKTVALVGKGPTLELSHNSKADEIWTFTQAWRIKPPRIDRVFEIHPYDFLVNLGSDVSKKHVEWLREDHDFVIYTQEKYEDFPASEPYPLDEVLEMLPRRFLKSSIAYAMALAIYEQWDCIELYGISMLEDSEYRYQRDNMHYLIGFAEAKGIEVPIPGNAGLIKDHVLYGYDTTQWVNKDILETHRKAYEKQAQQAEVKLRYRIERLEKDPQDAEKQEQAEDAERIAYLINGAIAMVDYIQETYLPEGGWLDRSTVNMEKIQQQTELEGHLGEYNHWLGRWKETQSQKALQKMADHKAKWQYYSGAKLAAENLMAEVDLEEPDLEIT
jgi:hypothetical protein